MRLGIYSFIGIQDERIRVGIDTNRSQEMEPYSWFFVYQ